MLRTNILKQKTVQRLIVAAIVAATFGFFPGLTMSAQAAVIVTFDADTSLTLANGVPVTILSGSTAQSVAVNEAANTITVLIESGDSFTLRSPNNHHLLNDSGLDACLRASDNKVQITLTAAGTVVFTPNYASICVFSSGSSSPAPVITPTPVVIPTPTITPTLVVTPPAAEALPVTAAPVAKLIHDPSDFAGLLVALGATAKPADFAKYSALVNSDALAFKVGLTSDQQTTIANFVTYGASAATVKLGAGERRALVRDYLETTGYANVNWDDVQRMAMGQKPVHRNLAKEQAQVGNVLKNWMLVVKHAPNFKDPAEDLAWNTLMYRIRFPRDLVIEQQGILKFKKIFKRNPSTPLDWSIVRATGYALK